MIRCLLVVCLFLVGCATPTPAPGQGTLNFNSYVNGLPVADPPNGSEQLYILQSGISKKTPAQNLANAPLYNVKSFGAVGNGVTDDSAAILAAETACSKNPGIVEFPAGTYLQKTGVGYLDISGCTIQGAGIGATFIRNTDLSFPGDIAFNISGSFTALSPTFYAINTPATYAGAITTTAHADAGNFTAGQNILVSGAYQSTSFPYPSLYTKVVSANAGTGVITLADAIPINGAEFSQVQVINSLVHDIVIADLSILQVGNGANSPCINFSVASDVVIDHVACYGGTNGGSGISGTGRRITIKNSSCFGDATTGTCNFDCTSSQQCKFQNNFLTGFQAYEKFEGGTWGSSSIGDTVFAPISSSGFYIAARSQANQIIGLRVLNIPGFFGAVTIDGGTLNEGNNSISDLICTGANVALSDCVQLGIHVRSDGNSVRGVHGDNFLDGIISDQGSTINVVSDVLFTNTTHEITLNGGASLVGPQLAQPLNFSGLSAVGGTAAYIIDGNAANCGDSACTTFGTAITGGGGALKLLAWYNGTAWTLIGK